jgi:pimeloyl-ACP methyl ester carboxylesterase
MTNVVMKHSTSSELAQKMVNEAVAKVDVLGFSIGGFIAQEIALRAPNLVKRLVLVGTGPRGGEGMATLTPEAQKIFGPTYDDPELFVLHVSMFLSADERRGV